jgi:serine/threonine-protein kinase
MVINKIDDIEFRLKEEVDFSWLNRYGTAFTVIDATGSGCLCVGMMDGKNKYFCKVAGVNTMEAEVTPKEAVSTLKNAVQIYRDLKHPNLVEIMEAYAYKDYYVAVFKWVEGLCLFDHWNFEKYQDNPTLKRPIDLFKALPVQKKLQAVDVIFSFFVNTSRNNYVAVDFYDGSIIYDFANEKITLCDIDFFRKVPVTNDRGEEWFGTKRLKAPEEYVFGAVIDEITNIYTLGALIFDIFGTFSKDEIRRRYENNSFYPCSLNEWSLSEKCYDIAMKAVQKDRMKRFGDMTEFYSAWFDASSELRI